MGGGSTPSDADVLAAVRAWERVRGEFSRRVLMIYRECDGGGLVVDVLELIGAETWRSPSGQLLGRLVVCSPQVQTDPKGQRYVSWSKQHRIPMEHVVHKKALPNDWPGCDSFLVNHRDPAHRDMQRQYEAEVQRGLKVAAEKGFK